MKTNALYQPTNSRCNPVTYLTEKLTDDTVYCWVLGADRAYRGKFDRVEFQEHCVLVTEFK